MPTQQTRPTGAKLRAVNGCPPVEARGARRAARPTSFLDLLGIATICVGAALFIFDYVLTVAHAEEKFEFYIYFQEPEDFLKEAFDGAPPAPQVLQLGESEQQKIREVYGRPFPKPRIHYWGADGKTAWIFDDVGKEGYQPTTSGFVVQDGKVLAARVLTYRESRGEEVGENFFLEQLAGAEAEGPGIDQQVDSITGATESVEMMKRMTRTAITFDSLVK